MEGKYLNKLEYPKIIELLAECTAFSLSREMAENLEPYKTLQKANNVLKETEEGVNLLRLYPVFSVGSVKDIKEELRRVELGGTLNIKELIDIYDTCRSSRQIKAFFDNTKEDFPNFKRATLDLSYFKTIESALDKAITKENTIADTASENLYRIRGKINIQSNRVKERLDNFLHSPHSSKYLQEPIVTLRNDRYVVPIKQEFRNQVQGIVHDTSSSGATLFIEPLSVLEANNELAKLRLEEEEEINAILRALTSVIAGFSEELKISLDTITYIDFIIAKAKLAGQMNAELPKLNDKGNINLKAARHPLIKGDVVPIDITLSNRIRTMVITGPNTGGKTVTLKTLGLLTLMSQSGLYIPAEYGSDVAIYEEVFADIGDEQSIEQSLSTFSAHMKNIVHILEKADSRSLVLMDELGSGTDPAEGAALAMSILEYLNNFAVKVVATTHYSELKSFAYNRAGFINASVEFDIETLSPTYRLLMGVPGRSNAFEIASKLGLNDVIINRASTFMNIDELQAAELIANLEMDKKVAEKTRAEVEELQKNLNIEKQKLKDLEVEFHNKEVEILRKAHIEAAALVSEAKKKSEELYQELKVHLKDAAKEGREVQKARQKMKQMEAELQKNIPQEKFAGVELKSVLPGEKVFLPKYNQYGTVLARPDNGGNIQVQVGIMKMTVDISELRIAENPKEKKDFRKSSGVGIEKSRTIKTEVDVRGKNAEEAMEIIDKYLDDAFLANLPQVRIIHGKGTGALRAALTPYFKKHRLVKTSRLGDYHEGGIGCTVLELKG